MRPARAVARRVFADARVSNGSFALFFGLIAYVQAVGYLGSFPMLHDRMQFAASFGDNKAIRLFYGEPHDLLTVSGYCAWRVGGTLALFTAVWGLLAAVRALRGEEDRGRAELMLAGTVGRGGAFLAVLGAIMAGATILWLALCTALVAGALPVGGSAYLALAVVSVGPVYAGVGALASQLAPTRRIATELGCGVFALTFAARVVADTSAGMGWLRWATPLGWSEELRAFTGARPAVLLLPLISSAALFAIAGRIALRRDIGCGLLASRDRAAPRLRLLSSPMALALRNERGSLIAWLVGVGAFALIFGVISKSVTSASLSPSLERQLEKVGGASLTTASGYLGLVFLFFVVAISLFACAQVAAIRGEEVDGHLETLFAHPIGRGRWLAGRLALATLAAASLAIVAGVMAWAGAATQRAGVSLGQMLEAGANCLPAALLFGALGVLAFALAPRATAGTAYGLVAVAFVWELVGALVGAPAWALGLSPFHHVGLVPAQPFQATAALAMLAIGAAAALAAAWAFRRRDLRGA